MYSTTIIPTARFTDEERMSLRKDIIWIKILTWHRIRNYFKWKQKEKAWKIKQETNEIITKFNRLAYGQIDLDNCVVLVPEETFEQLREIDSEHEDAPVSTLPTIVLDKREKSKVRLSAGTLLFNPELKEI